MFFVSKKVAGDHLHIRGEYFSGFVTEITSSGSPPHTWRIPPLTALSKTVTRITSTYVENTS